MTHPTDALRLVPSDTALLATINYLRAEEGDTVSLLCDNPDFNGQPNNAVECNGGWTDWTDKRFTGDSLFAALNNAALAKAVATKTLAPKPLAAPASPLPEGGGDWSAIRNAFVRHAEAFVKASRYEEASAIADKAAREIQDLMSSLPAAPTGAK